LNKLLYQNELKFKHVGKSTHSAKVLHVPFLLHLNFQFFDTHFNATYKKNVKTNYLKQKKFKF